MELLSDAVRKFGESSRTVAGVRRVKESLRRSTIRSVLSGSSSDASSSPTGTSSRSRGYGEEWFAHSTAAKVAAVPVRAVSTVESWVVSSYLYRWLTAEPDPEVIVIDLRETYTVGPFVRAVDRVTPTVATAVRGSSAWSIAERTSERIVVPVSESRVVQLLAAVLAPPEPPKATDGETNEPEGSEDEFDGTESDEER